MVARCSEGRSRPSVGPQRPPAHPLKALDEPDKSVAGVHRDSISFAGARPRKSGRAQRPTQALPRLASLAGLRLENHELGRARRDAARLRRSGGHYDDDKHVIITGRPALRPLVGLILDTLSCILQALLANRSMGASSTMAGATTSPTRACVHAPVSTLTRAQHQGGESEKPAKAGSTAKAKVCSYLRRAMHPTRVKPLGLHRTARPGAPTSMPSSTCWRRRATTINVRAHRVVRRGRRRRGCGFAHGSGDRHSAADRRHGAARDQHAVRAGRRGDVPGDERASLR